MRRNFIEKLIEWKESPNRKPLVLWGARQVGKTWLLKEFGKTCFENVLYISFYNNKKDSDLFERDYDTKRILGALEIQHHIKILPSKTLIIFDEIQAAPKVLESLKYFCEEASEYALVAAGSLLGVSIHEGLSFPVGKVNELRLFPMTFSEFLLALGEENLARLIEEKNPENPLISDLRETFIPFLRDYYFTGGMPEAVLAFVESRDYDKVRSVQNDIISQYEGDFGKHVDSKELPRIRMVWNSLPMQLAKENKKFFFAQIKSGARMKEFEIAIQWLCDAGLIYKVQKVSKPAMPLKAYSVFSDFKIYLNDIGLLAALSELDKDSIISGNDVFVEFKSALTEQYVLQELKAMTSYTPYYYSGEKSTYEVDFLIQQGKLIVPLEVKAEENVKAKSLRFFVDKFESEYAVRTSMSNYRKEEWLTNIPLWAVSGV
ncbi:MAG: ATP-binding protein [Treponema sp.]|uniref:ATP-binding protein n=1 Tax=Treponema sp. TaxID=166 RepID=UPI0025D3E4C6|nr:AAA family ATPase [Treponema sp.]MBQ9282073.1 ATP-binding protein [Treponema sp.]